MAVEAAALAATDDDIRKPIIGVASTWTETMPCNFTLRGLAERVKEGVRRAGGTPMEFNTISVSDGVSMSVGYRYFKTEKFDYENAFPETQSTDITQQSVDVGLQFHL